MTDFNAPLRLHLDGEALVANWRFLQQQGSAPCGAAVKANGYGLGAREVVSRLRDAGCRDFFVAHWQEATAIADLVPPQWISVLNGIAESEIPLVRRLGAVPVLNTPKQIMMWKLAEGGPCHVMLDSGINRLGIGHEQFSPELFEALNIDIVMSHLASADEDTDQNAQQLRLFGEQAKLVNAKRRSLANSAGIMLGADYHFDLTRPGLALYGGIARPEMAGLIKPVVSLSARILQVRQLETGDRVGYNGTFICPRAMRIGTISLGYADGYLRAFSGQGHAIHASKKMPFIGRVSMDQLAVDLSTTNEVGEGDWLEIDYDLARCSRATALSQYELLTNLGDRYDRVWLKKEAGDFSPAPINT